MRRQVTSLLVLIAIAIPAARGEIIISSPFVGGKAVKPNEAVEAGATPQVTIKYRNASAAEVAISSVELNLRYKPEIIDNIISVTNNQPGKLIEREFNAANPGEINYKLESALFTKSEPKRSTFTVSPNKTIDLATISFHLAQDQKATGASFPLFTVSPGGNKILDQLNDVTQGVAALPQVKLAAGAPPDFDGQTKVLSKGFDVNNVGNTLSFNWENIGLGASELTRFPNGKLKCKVERSTDPKFEGAVDLPLLGDPPTSNIEGKDYVYMDGPGTGIPGGDPLSDGTTYYYKISAADDTSPTPNETKNTPVISGIPYDFTPPREVTKPSAANDDGKVILKWVNPTDPDFGGVLIMKNRDQPVAPDGLEGATSAGHGKSYQEGEEPFGPGKGKVIYVSPQADFSPADVQQDYEDPSENGVLYHYKVFTYDRAIDGPPKELGRNYSRGVEVTGRAGVVPKPISNFIVKKGDYPGEVLFNWDNSPDPFCEGILIRYSTDDRKRFGALTDEKTGKLAGIFPLSSAPGQPDYAYLTLPSGFNYYFKAFAYNMTNEPLDPANKENMAAHAFSAGQTDSLPLLVSKEEELFAYTYNFQKGINHFAVPFPADRVTNKDGKVVNLSTWENLIDELNAQAGDNAITSFGRWNEVEQKAEGIIAIDYARAGAGRYITTKGVTPTQSVIQGGAFEITSTKPFSFTLKNIAPQPQY